MNITKEQFEILLKMEADISQVKAATSAVSGLRGGLDKLIGLRGGLAGLLGGLSATAVIGGMTRLTEQAAQLSGRIENARATIGTTAKEFQTFAGVLKDAGGGGEEFIGAISRVQKLVGEAAAGGKQAQDAFRAVGLSFSSLRAQSAAEQLESIAVALSKIPNESARAAASSDILGKSYAELRPLLDGLATKGFAGLSKEVEASRGMLSDEYSKALDQAKNRTEAAAEKMAKALTPIRILWEQIKAGAAQTLATLADPASANVGGGGRSQSDIRNEFARRRAEAIKADNKALISLLDEAIAKLDAELAAEKKITAERQTRQRLLTQRAPAAGRNGGLREVILMQFDANAAARRREEAAADFDAALKKRQLLQASLEQGNAAFMRAQKEEQLRKVLEKKNAAEERQFALEQSLGESRAKIEAISGNRSLTDLQKNALISTELRKQNVLIQERIDALKEQIAVEDDAAAKLELRRDVASLKGEQISNNAEIGNRSPTTVMDDFSNGLADLQNGFLTFGQSFANVMGAALNGVTTQLTNAILYTGQFGLALHNISQIILQEIVMSMIRMGAQWVTTHILMKSVSSAWYAFLTMMGWAQVKQVTAQEAVKAPILAANAASASAGSWGVSALVGLAAFIAAFGAVMALAGGFEYGGYTGDGARSGGLDGKGGFLAMLHPQETVIDHHHGTIGDMRIATPSAPQAPESTVDRSVVNGQGAGPTAVNLAVFDQRHQMQSWLNTRQGEAFMVDFMKERGFAKR